MGLGSRRGLGRRACKAGTIAGLMGYMREGAFADNVGGGQGFRRQWGCLTPKSRGPFFGPKYPQRHRVNSFGYCIV